MKVLFFSNIPSPYRVEFFNLLAEKCDLTVIYERENASDRNERWRADDNSKYKVHFMKGLYYSNDASISLDFTKYIKNKKYDVIVISGYSSLTQILLIRYFKRRKIPFVLNIDGAILKDESGVKRSIKSSLISSASYWLSTGEASDKYLIHYGARSENIFRYPFTSVSETHIIDSLINEDEKKEYKKAIGCDASKLVLSVGQPIHRKGFDILIKAMKQFKDADICTVIVGGAPDPECEIELEEARGSDIRFVSFKSQEELSVYYKAADLFVFPTREDIWGLVINEAMAYGLPIVTTDKCNAGLELVSDGVNGYVVPSENEVRLYDAVKEVLFDKNISSMSRESLKRIKLYSLENMATEHIRIFENITGKH